MEARRTVVERGGASDVGGYWRRAVADGQDSSKCYPHEGERDDYGLEHCEWLFLLVWLAWDSLNGRF